MRAARGDWVVTLDGDGQSDHADIPGLLAVLHNSGPSTELLRPSALILKHAEDAGDATGYVGRYEGQFHFLGRLTHPIDELKPAALPA